MTLGRHSVGRPGLTRRGWAGGAPQRNGAATAGRRPPRHRRVRSARQSTADAMPLLAALAVLGILAVSGWYTASGATAVVQMLAR